MAQIATGARSLAKPHTACAYEGGFFIGLKDALVTWQSQSTWLLLYPYRLLVWCFFLFFGISGKTQQNDLYNGTKATLELILLGVVKFDLCHHLGMVLG